MDEFASLKKELSTRVGETKGLLVLMHSSPEDRQRWDEELKALGRRVEELEAAVASARSKIEEERVAIEEALRTLRAKAIGQQEEIEALYAALPSHMLPTAATTTTTTTQQEAPPPTKKTKKPQPQQQQQPQPATGCITATELEGVPSYMRGRLTPEKLNAALDEARRLIDRKYRALGSGRQREIVDPDKLDALKELEDAASGPAGGSQFFSELDITESTILRQDQAGKMLIATLRHLGRIKEFVAKSKKCWVLME